MVEELAQASFHNKRASPLLWFKKLGSRTLKKLMNTTPTNEREEAISRTCYIMRAHTPD
jgi:hypothetical protein